MSFSRQTYDQVAVNYVACSSSCTEFQPYWVTLTLTIAYHPRCHQSQFLVLIVHKSHSSSLSFFFGCLFQYFLSSEYRVLPQNILYTRDRLATSFIFILIGIMETTARLCLTKHMDFELNNCKRGEKFEKFFSSSKNNNNSRDCESGKHRRLKSSSMTTMRNRVYEKVNNFNESRNDSHWLLRSTVKDDNR